MLQELLVATLEDAGISVSAYPDGEQALLVARADSTDSTDAAVLDGALPSLPALEVCRALRAERTAPLPIVLLAPLALDVAAADDLVYRYSSLALMRRLRELLTTTPQRPASAGRRVRCESPVPASRLRR